MNLNKTQIIDLLPHREPMLLIDELINIKKLHSATAIMNVKKDAFYVNGHFPGNPVMPGVLIVEAFGQAAAALTAAGIDKKEYENKLVFLMSVEKARFRSPVIPDCKLELNIEAITCEHWAKGGEGTVDLANKVVELAEQENNFKFIYSEDIPLIDKVRNIAKEIYRADDIVVDNKILDQLAQFEEAGYGKFPICIAKTQYSFSTDPNKKGAPVNHSIPIREVRLSSGAEFIVVVCGEIMTMPGLPSVPAANSIRLNSQGEIEGLF